MNLQEKDGESALIIAVRNGHTEVVKVLLEYGADMNLRNKDGLSALIISNQQGYVKLTKIMQDYSSTSQQPVIVSLQTNTGFTKQSITANTMRQSLCKYKYYNYLHNKYVADRHTVAAIGR